MTSEIRANTLKNRVGLGTISFSSTGPIVSGIVTVGNGGTAVNLTGDLSISHNIPKISLIDTDNNSDYEIKNQNGAFTIRDTTNSIDRFNINSNGNIGINYSGTPTATLDIRTDLDPTNGVMCFLRNNTNDGNGALYGMDINGCGTWSCGMLDNSNNFSIVKGSGNSGDEYFRVTSDGVVLIGTENADSIGTIASHLVVGSTTNNDEVALTLNVMEGTNNRRVKFFLDDDGGVFGIDSTASTGVAPFVVRMAAVEKLRITSDGEVRIANGGLLTIKTDAAATYGVSEALRIDDAANTVDRPFQIFEYQNSGSRWFSFNQNLNVTTNGSAYTYTQGNYGGSNMIEMNGGTLRIFANESVTGGSTNAITPIERLRINSDGSIGINANPTAGDMTTGSSQNKPLLHVYGSGSSGTSGAYNLLARFEAGGDADGTGAMIVLNHSNDRGLAIEGGRRTGNYAHGALKMIDNVGRVSDAMLIHGGAGVGVEYISFFTGASITTTEKLRISANGHVIPGSNNTQDLGSTAKGWRNIYTNDLNLSNMNGEINDIDGTQGSWTIQEGKDDLYIINRLNGKKFKIKMEEIS